MRANIRGLESIRKMRDCIDMHKVKTPAGALQELTKLAHEKERLKKEKGVAERNLERINSRLEEIAKMERWVRKFTDGERADPPAKMKIIRY